MEAKQITKKHFIELLATRKNILLGNPKGEVPQHRKIEVAIATHLDNHMKKIQPADWRTCKRVRSNAIEFSGGSCISLNQIGRNTYHQIGENVIYQHLQCNNGWYYTTLYLLS